MANFGNIPSNLTIPASNSIRRKVDDSGFEAYIPTLEVPIASASVVGGIAVGDRLTITGSVLSADIQSGSQVVPLDHDPVENFYLTGYDNTTGLFSSGSVAPSSGVSVNHNDLPDLQGGQADEYYHLTEAEHTIATQASGSGQDGYLTKEDYSQFKLASSGSGAWYLDELLDVDAGSPEDGQALIWDNDTSKWTPGTVSASSASALSDLTDVSISGSLINGQLLIYNSGCGLWFPGTISVGNNIYPSFTSPPALDTWTWRNQGTATVSGAENKIYMKTLALAGDNWKILERNYPTPPFTLTAAFLMTLVGYNNACAGLALIESSSGKLITYHVSGDAADSGFNIIKWNSATSYNSSYLKTLARLTGTAIVYLRIIDDNTNRIMYFSFDGVNFVKNHSVGRTDFCTPDKIGFGISAANATYDAALCLLSWKVE